MQAIDKIIKINERNLSIMILALLRVPSSTGRVNFEISERMREVPPANKPLKCLRVWTMRHASVWCHSETLPEARTRIGCHSRFILFALARCSWSPGRLEVNFIKCRFMLLLSPLRFGRHCIGCRQEPGISNARPVLIFMSRAWDSCRRVCYQKSWNLRLCTWKYGTLATANL